MHELEKVELCEQIAERDINYRVIYPLGDIREELQAKVGVRPGPGLAPQLPEELEKLFREALPILSAIQEGVSQLGKNLETKHFQRNRK